jgi:hypothetical protein
LRETPKAFDTKHIWKQMCGQEKKLGYGKNSKDDTLANVKMGNPQPSPKAYNTQWMQFRDLMSVGI